MTQLKVMRHESGICDISEGNYHLIFFVGKLGKQSYKSMFSGVFVSAVGESFYHQCLPDNSVNLGISTNAITCLSKM